MAHIFSSYQGLRLQCLPFKVRLFLLKILESGKCNYISGLQGLQPELLCRNKGLERG